MMRGMTSRPRLVLVLSAAVAVLAGSSASAAPKAPAPTAVQEVITIQRTATTGLAALALIGKVQASKVPGFFATVDRSASNTRLRSIVDFNSVSGITRYGHGEATPLCDAPVVCAVDLSTDTLTFSITETSDADNKGDRWSGLTRYLAIRGTKIDLQVAAIGFTVKRHTAASFARVTRDDADADGVGVSNAGVEVFRAAQLPGKERGSFALLQLPCDVEGVGVATFAATGDLAPNVVNCQPSGRKVGVGVGYVSTSQQDGDHPGLYSRTSSRATQWQVSGAVAGISGTATRLFVLSY